jgi:hypothetical protein
VGEDDGIELFFERENFLREGIELFPGHRAARLDFCEIQHWGKLPLEGGYVNKAPFAVAILFAIVVLMRSQLTKKQGNIMNTKSNPNIQRPKVPKKQMSQPSRTHIMENPKQGTAKAPKTRKS